MPLYRAELLAKKPLRYAALIHDVSQVLHLPFDYDDGPYARDRSGYNNHSTIYGATLTAGKIGMGRKFDGTDDYVKIPPNPSLDNIKEFTLCAWVRVDGWVKWMRAISLDSVNNTINLGRYSDTTEAFVHFIDVGGTPHIAPGGTLKVGVPTFLAGTFKRPNLRLYQDGVLVATVSADAEIRSYTGGVHNVGARLDGAGQPWNGLIDEPRIYTRELSANEIRILMYRRL